MKKILLAACTMGLLLVPAALAVEPQTASDYCKTLRSSQPALFGAGKTYKNLGACVSTQNAKADANTAGAAKVCKAEMADPNFAASHGDKTFAAFYGTNAAKGNGNGNAFGKCVSQHASQQTAAEQGAETKAAKACKAEMKLTAEQFAAKYPGKTFATKYGTNTNARNAFGKCVSTLAAAA